MDPKVFEDLDVAKISVLKNRPSVSHFDNADNASDNFCDKNTGLKEVTKNSVNTFDEFLMTSLF